MATTTRSISKAEAFLLTHIHGLIAYAARDAVFAESLAAAIQQRSWSAAPVSELAPSTHLVPADQSAAITSAHWLIAALDTHPEFKTARGTLVHFADNYESPKDFVIGIVGVAVIGPTLGIINNKKKRSNQMQIVIDQNWHAASSEKERLALVQQLSQQVIAKELGFAGGNVYQLHPDSAAWALDDPATKIYVEPSTAITHLQTIARTEKLSHVCSIQEDNTLRAIAISPAVNDGLVHESLE